MIYVGKIVSTHGIKGEVKILSDFQFKEKVFVVGKNLYINDECYKIRSYRRHKNFDMVTLNDYNNINDILFLMKSKVYIKEEELDLNDDEVLDSDLLEYKAIDNTGREGQVLEIFFASSTNKIMRVLFDKEYLIPINSPMFIGIDKNKKEVRVNIEEYL